MSRYVFAGRRLALSNVRAVFGGSMVHLVIAVVACLLPVLCRGVRCSASRYTGIRMRVGCLVLWQGNWSCLLFATGVDTAITAIAILLPVATDYHCHEGHHYHYHDHYCHWCRWWYCRGTATSTRDISTTATGIVTTDTMFAWIARGYFHGRINFIAQSVRAEGLWMCDNGS